MVSEAVAALAARTRRLLTSILDAVLPPRCLSCGGPIDRQGMVCPGCWYQLSFIGTPLCGRCGVPFEFATSVDGSCSECLASPPLFARARAVLIYDDACRPLVFGLKHGDQTFAAKAYGAWLARAGADILADADLLVPVPLNRWRLFRRRYNQSALLAESICRSTGIAHSPDLLIRHRSTPIQGGLSRAGRQRNVAGAFRVRATRVTALTNANVVIVDDVLTTGATVSECARVLLRAGAARVDVLTLARVVKAR